MTMAVSLEAGFYILTIVVITSLILVGGIVPCIQQQAYSNSVIENLANSFFTGNNNTTSGSTNSYQVNSSKSSHGAMDISNELLSSSHLQSQQLTSTQICLNSSTIRDEFAKQQCNAIMDSKLLGSNR